MSSSTILVVWSTVNWRKGGEGIPPPCEIELPLTASYVGVLQVGKDNFFDDDEITLDHLTLADTGTRSKIKDQDKWTIGDFYNKNELKPSRYKYVIYMPPVSPHFSTVTDILVV